MPVKVLIVEDNDDDYIFALRCLSNSGNAEYAVKRATTIGESLFMLERNQFDVVLVDLSLPDSHGIDSFVSVFYRIPSTPIIILTGDDSEITALEAIKHGAQDYLVKGRDIDKFIARSIQYAIGRSSKHKSIKTLDDLRLFIAEEKRMAH